MVPWYHSLSSPLGNPLYSPLPPKRCSVFLGPYSPELDQEHAGHHCVSPNERASSGPSCLQFTTCPRVDFSMGVLCIL